MLGGGWSGIDDVFGRVNYLLRMRWGGVLVGSVALGGYVLVLAGLVCRVTGWLWCVALRELGGLYVGAWLVC